MSSPRLLIIVVWGGHELFADILKQEQVAYRLGYLGATTIPEHPSIIIRVKAHFDNYLMSDYIGEINYASKKLCDNSFFCLMNVKSNEIATNRKDTPKIP